MITVCISLIFLGCIFLYNTSERAVLDDGTSWKNWVSLNKKKSKLIGGALLLIALVLSNPTFGTTSGILFWLLTLSTILGLIVIVAPLRKISYQHILALMVLSFLVEIIF